MCSILKLYATHDLGPIAQPICNDNISGISYSGNVPTPAMNAYVFWTYPLFIWYALPLCYAKKHPERTD